MELGLDLSVDQQGLLNRTDPSNRLNRSLRTRINLGTGFINWLYIWAFFGGVVLCATIPNQAF